MFGLGCFGVIEGRSMWLDPDAEEMSHFARNNTPSLNSRLEIQQGTCDVLALIPRTLLVCSR